MKTFYLVIAIFFLVVSTFSGAFGLTETQVVRYSIISWIALGTFSILSATGEIKNALAEGKEAQGTYQEERITGKGSGAQGLHVASGGYADTSGNRKLYGHWHAGRWDPIYGTGQDRQWQETREVKDCVFVRAGIPEACQFRNPRSTT